MPEQTYGPKCGNRVDNPGRTRGRNLRYKLSSNTSASVVIERLLITSARSGDLSSSDALTEGAGKAAPAPASAPEFIDEEDLDTFVSLVRRHPVDEAERRLLRLGIQPNKAKAIREAYEARARRLKELRDPPSLDSKNGDVAWYGGPGSDDLFWAAIRELLKSQGWSDQDLTNLDAASTKVLARMQHPQTERFTTRGLVIGHVQSGKTSNFTSVIAKAADRDYRVFIVLSGVHNSLREQTQERLDGHLVVPNPEYWMPLTGPNRDFVAPENATVYLSRVGEHHVLCVVKKNAMRLQRLKEWLQSAQTSALAQCPVLIIDDEADQASVATARINGLIRDILQLLPKAAYIGYTATPFANLLIDPAAKDLYPSDFIIDLPQPKDHFATEVIFGRDAVEGEEGEGPLDGYDMVRIVPDDELPHLRPAPRESPNDFTPDMTPTLRRAILYFWLATAARRVRGTGVPHSTMLVHTSMRIAVQESFRQPIEILRAETVRKLAEEDRPLLEELREIWEQETARVDPASFGESLTPFKSLRKRLPEVVGETRVIMDNSRSRERLSYSGGDPVVAIAVGGNTLSRGLTLEGLVVSFFVRSSSAYDTLLQMGRWFGYRRGYADLPRTWMTDELRRWFRHIALVELEIRRDIRRYEEENLTPEDFAVRIRTHPSLAITAASKMRDAVRAEASFGGRRVQTRYFWTNNRDWLDSNIEAAQLLVSDAIEIDGASVESHPDGYIILRKVKAASILKFLRGYQVHENSFELDRGLVERYISRQNEKGHLLDWNVALIGGEPAQEGNTFDFGHGLTLKKIRRAKLKDGPVDYADIKTLMSKEHRVIDLPGISQSEARKLRETRLMSMRKPGDPALLALFPIDRISPPDPQNEATRVNLNAAKDVIGMALVFPGRGDEEAVTYMSADLSRLGMSADDVEEPEEEDPEAEGVASA